METVKFIKAKFAYICEDNYIVLLDSYERDDVKITNKKVERILEDAVVDIHTSFADISGFEVKHSLDVRENGWNYYRNYVGKADRKTLLTTSTYSIVQ
jgi:hypothetical protein